ncbi:AMP-binding protein [bacterium]|nr:AMP-binding protein [bacterium]
MTNERKEKYRKLQLKRKFLSGRRQVNRFLSDKTSFNEYFKQKISNYKKLQAITDTYNNLEINYTDLENNITNLAASIQSFGIKKGDFVGIFTENNGLWATVEQATMRCGAICTLRGSNAPVEELDYIISHSEAKGLILKDANLLQSLKPYINKYNLNFIIIMFKKDNDDLSEINCPVYYYEDAVETGKNKLSEFNAPEQSLDENCLMLYTSGTTGMPKGVLITHKNLLAQMPSIEVGFMSQPGENTLQILPVWHAYEHITQLYYLVSGCHLHFTTLSGLKNDLARYKIDTFMSVPRIWEALRLGIFQKLKQKSILVYKIFDFAVKLSITYKIHKMYSERRITNKKGDYHFLTNIYHKLARSFLKPLHVLFTNTLYKTIKNAAGINFRASISGGGALSMKDQLFYDAIGVNLREGYGLTETSPVLTLRYISEPNFLGCCGKPFMGTEIKVLNIETKEELGILQKGVVYVRGPQVTKGYYKDENATKEVFSEDGWFNTGDIGWLTADNNLVLVGRLKETIVLSNGENVEPLPIEEACLESPYIDQIMLVGQDQSSIGALIVPSEAALQKCGILAKDIKSGTNLTISNPTLRELIKKEIATYIKNKKNLKSFEKIKDFEVINENFSTTNGLMSQTAKMKRNSIFEKYKNLISKMFDKM